MRKSLMAALLGLFLATGGAASWAGEKKQETVYVPLNQWTAVAMRKGWLPEEYARVGARVELVDVAAMKIPGVEVSLLEKGKLHFVNCMGYLSIQHKLNGLDSEVVWASKLPHPRRATTVVLKNFPANSLAGLKGKNLGGWRISCPYFATYEALKDQGVQQDTDFQKGDVRYTNIAPAAQVAALLSGKIDALSVHPATTTIAPLYTQNYIKELAPAKAEGAYVKGGGRSAIFTLREFATKHPERVQAFLRAYVKTRRWIRGNPDAASAIIAREMRIPKQVAKFTIVDNSQMLFSDQEPDYKKVVASYNLFQSWGIKNGDDLLKKRNLSPPQIEAFIDKKFFKDGQFFIGEQ